MAFYVYSPGNPRALEPETIGLTGASLGDIESERHLLLNAGMNAISRGEARRQEVTQQLAKADYQRLPVELVSRLMDPDYYTAPIMHAGTGLAMYAPRKAGSPNFALLTEAVEDIDELVTEGRMDSDTLEHLSLRKAITHDALQHQEIEYWQNGRKRRTTLAHDSFGRLINGAYIPIVTVLNRQHPVVQLVEQQRQERNSI